MATLLVTELIGNIFLIDAGGRFKFRFHAGHLNPFISRDKAFIIWVVQLIIAALLSTPLGFYFEKLISINQFYYIPILCLMGIAFIVFGTKILRITMSKNMWIAIIVFSLVFVVSLYLLTNGQFSKLPKFNLITS